MIQIVHNISKFTRNETVIALRMSYSVSSLELPLLSVCANLKFCRSCTGADPARVHWVHVHPPCARVHVHSVLNAQSTLNV